MWNVNGILSRKSHQCKLNDPFFIDVVKHTDIVALVETQASPDMSLALDGYVTYRKDRPKSNNGRHFGGWAVFIKKEIHLTGGLNLIKETHDYVWFKLNKEIFNFNEDIFLCILHVYTTCKF